MCGAPSALAGDELVAVAESAHNEWLDDAARADRLGELLQRVFAESRPGLIGAGIDQVNVDIQQTVILCRGWTRERRCLNRLRRRQRFLLAN